MKKLNHKGYLKALISLAIVISACSPSPNSPLPTTSNNNQVPVNSNPSSPTNPSSGQGQQQVTNIPTPQPLASLPPVSPTESQYFISRSNPQISPNGKRIVFVRGYKIYVSDLEGTNNVLVADLQKENPSISLSAPILPTWSPKGDKIGFIVRGLFSQGEMYIINADASKIYYTKDVHFSNQFSWFPDGEKVLFSEKNGLATINADGSNLTYLKFDNGSSFDMNSLSLAEIAISPDGTKMFVNSSYDEFYTYDFQNKKKNTIPELKSHGMGRQGLSWSPDSKNIILATYGEAGELLSINVSDSKITVLSKDGGGSPRWSPDGKRIAYSGLDSANSKLFVRIANPDGSIYKTFELPYNQQVFDYISYINWSPDNNKIAFTTQNSSYIADISTGNFNKISDSALFMQWTLDSNKLFYSDKSNEAIISDFNGNNKINLFVRPVNPIVSQFNIKSPSDAEISEVNSSTIVEANSKFALKIFSELAKEKTNENLFISPLSMSLALAMTYNGAENKTKDEMMNTLEYQNLTLDNVNKYNNTLLRLLLSDQDIQLSIANGIFSKKGVNFKQDFLTRNKENYFSEISELDFDSPSAVSTINKWVSDNTNDKIPSILDKIDPEDVIYLINAIYFKGTWTNVFEKSLTKDQSFKLANGTTKQHPMMNQKGRYRHFKDENVEFIRMPYGNSQRMGMYLFLPKEGISLENFRANLNYETLNKWLAEMSSEDGNITIPKFKMEYEAKLIEPLKKLGMVNAFNPNTADFSKMSDIKTYLTKALQKTFVEVNEEGTEAAAATIVGASATSVPPPPFNFVVDRPFMTAIVDERTKTILFMGLIYEPK